MKNDLRAKDVMRRELISVREDADFWSAVQTLLQNGITGAPVVNAADDLVGVISQTDLLRYVRSQAAEGLDFYSDSEHDSWARVKTATVRDLMTRELIHAEGDSSLDELSKTMLRRRIHRILITQGKKLLGIVTTMDLLRVR